MIGYKKLKIFSIFVLSLGYNFVFSQQICNLENLAYLESPVFYLGDYYNLTKISWQGEKNENHFVGFQIASSKASSGPWYFYGRNFSSEYIEISPFQVYIFDKNNNPHQEIKYFKYKVFLGACEEFTTPKIDKIIIYYSK